MRWLVSSCVDLCWHFCIRLNQIITVKSITLCKSNFTFVYKKSKKQEKEPDTNFVILDRKHENAFTKTNQSSAISHTWENSKIFKIIPKYFSFLKDIPPVSWVVHITRVLVFHDSWSWRWPPTPIYIYRSQPSICIYKSWSIRIGTKKDQCLDKMLLF